MDTQQHIQLHLLIDGYIAHMFSPRAAEIYHVSLLGRESRLINWYTRVSPSLEKAFFAAPHRLGSNQNDWAIDYAINDTGPVIPQPIWAPRHGLDAQRYVHHEQLCPPIFFVHKNCRDLGLPLIEAAAGNCMSLRGADQIAPVGSGHHIQLRINWRGYAPLDSQIIIRKQTPPWETISLEMLAKYVARRVMNFMEAAKRDRYDYSDKYWFIGDSGITPHDITLVGVVQVSQGSWMPILQSTKGFEAIVRRILLF
ncbi:hypothetical protein BJV78DRAFT_687969 [Lactifluus subvellereus]|nr:hypothetical protein BJV78DRAFT_687969 [Lactifluus subvellereus]